MSSTFNFSLRMPDELGETIYDIAKADKRPMNTTIVMLLEYALKEKNRKKKSYVKGRIQHNTAD